MKDIAIYGAGGLGREVACLIRNINAIEPQWDLIGFFDDGIAVGSQIGTFGTVLGGREILNRWNKPLDVAICLGNPKTEEKVYNNIENPLITYPNIISPDFRVADKDSFSIGRGNIITHGCSVTTSVTIGDFNLMNGSVVIGHDTVIGDFNVFMPACRISGEVRIGCRNLFGAMSFVKQCVKIGNDVTLSPLSPLLRNPKDGHLYMGNPAKKIEF